MPPVTIDQAEPQLTALPGLWMAGACIWKEEQAVHKCQRKNKSSKLDLFLLDVVLCLAVPASLLGSIRSSSSFSPCTQLTNAFATYGHTKK